MSLACLSITFHSLLQATRLAVYLFILTYNSIAFHIAYEEPKEGATEWRSCRNPPAVAKETANHLEAVFLACDRTHLRGLTLHNVLRSETCHATPTFYRTSPNRGFVFEFAHSKRQAMNANKFAGTPVYHAGVSARENAGTGVKQSTPRFSPLNFACSACFGP